ncbi:phosphonate ABC transporter, permease protein PhnE [Roseicyclus mahoneyensis]|uniref:Phosphonate transport system permease protein n=1 Tax=Roseicyclus mahoneyensis TaxID=164332 RepID=A0A316GNR2_9RHOB|nr:phosphonate ABC transporter, permease protein PhnE [Roseicyclus mahoneyensis]PWK61991.1 phosphonate transport system permease protein [Roseicyclus mahoneyensis]
MTGPVTPKPSADIVTIVEAQRRDLQRDKRRQTLLFLGVLVVLVAVSGHLGEVSWQKFVNGIPRFGSYISRTLPPVSPETLWADLGRWMWAGGRWVGLLFDTVLIAFVATTLGVVAGFFLSFPAARNLAGGVVHYQLARRFLELMRTVPELVFAMLFVFAFGLGALAGVLAIALHTMGVLGKLFSEINETISDKSLEGVVAAGASRDQVIRLGVVPQVLPAFISYTLLRFEINVRSASVIGFVGAGGIGQELMFVINQFIYRDISAILLLLIITVALVDIVSEKIRHRILDGEQRR